jgi:hypothetical protein
MSDADTGSGGVGTGGAAGADAKDIQLQGLDLITQGITLALDELREIGMLGEAGMGRGFSELALSGMELGHEGLTSTLNSFCERWEWGVRSLVQEGNAFADAVGLSAGTLHETDQYIAGTLKIGANAVMGNPHLSEDEVSGMTWSEIGDHHALADPDWSRESWERAQENVDRTWNDVGGNG